jgi:NodT family efflux transporter outer membrane factor (OMF) lipoprotein
VKTRHLYRVAGGIALATLAACKTVGPDYALPDAAVYQRAEANAAFQDTGSAGIAAGAALPPRWWELYRDDTLNALIEQALHDNVELKVAAANLQRAAAVYEQALDAGGLESTASAGASRTQLSPEAFVLDHELPVFTLANGQVGVSYQFDMFGKFKRAAEAAHADTQATAAAMDLARITLVAQVAGSYSTICHANHELHVAEHALQLQQRSRDISQTLLEAGRGTPQQLSRAQAEVALAEASLPPLRAHRQAAEYQLAALLGRTPGQLPEDVSHCRHAPALQQPLPVGDGRALLARRPDIRQAERQLAAATARIGVATAQLYPDIRLGASLGAAGLLEDMGSALTRQWSIGQLISWTVPDKGAHARVAIARAGAEAALAEFDLSVLQALRETQTALSRYAQDLQRLAALRQAQQHAARVSEQDQRLYRGGRAPYQTHLGSEQLLARADSALADGEAQVTRDQIQLFLALGGGWASTPTAP